MGKVECEQHASPDPGHIFGVDSTRIGLFHLLERNEALYIGEDGNLPHNACGMFFIGKSINELGDEMARGLIIAAGA
jgi:hypothetical protein